MHKYIVDHVQNGIFRTSGGRFAGIDMADNDDVDMSLFFTVEQVDMSAMLIHAVLRAFAMIMMRAQL